METCTGCESDEEEFIAGWRTSNDFAPTQDMLETAGYLV